VWIGFSVLTEYVIPLECVVDECDSIPLFRLGRRRCGVPWGKSIQVRHACMSGGATLFSGLADDFPLVSISVVVSMHKGYSVRAVC